MGDGNKIEMLIAICALVSSLAAVFIAWDQGRVLRAQQHGAVFPVLQVEGFGHNTPTYSDLGVRVRNSGVGPALIESVILKVDGEVIDNFNTPLADLPETSSLTQTGLTGRALAPGEIVTPIEMAWRREDVTVEQMAEIAIESQKWELNICYCSVFDRCWETTGFGNGRAMKVPSCERQETDLFLSFTPSSLPLDVSLSENSENASAGVEPR